MRPLISLLALAVLLITACTPTPHSNPLDPVSAGRSATALSFSITNNITSIESKAIELNWRRSTDPEFYVYVLCRSESPMGIAAKTLDSNTLETIAKEFSSTSASNFWWFTPSDFATYMPTFATNFSPVTVLPDVNLNSYRDNGTPSYWSFLGDSLTSGKKYYYSYVVFLRNGRQYAASPEIAVETAPDFSSAKVCDLMFAYADIPTTINELEVDSSGYLYAGGTAWGITKNYVSSAAVGYDYFIVKTLLSDAFAGNGYIWEGQSIFLSGHTTFANSTPFATPFVAGVTTNLNRFIGFAVDDNYGIYIANIHYKSKLRFHMLSNDTGWYTGTRHLYYDPGYVTEKTTRIHLDRVNSTLYIAGGADTSVGVSFDLYVMDNLTWSAATAQQITFPQKVRIVGLDVDTNRDIYVCDAEINGVWRVPYIGPAINYGTPVFFGGGTGSVYGKYNDIGDLAIDPSTGAIFVADTGNDRIQKLDRNGVWSSSLNIKQLYGNIYASPKALRLYNNNLYIGTIKSILQIPLSAF